MQHDIRKNINITKDSKLIIGLGDSFVEGQGALSEETWSRYDWAEERLNYLNHEETDDGKTEYQLIREEENSNCFLTVLCDKYLSDFTPINFGYRGNGNRAAVKALTTLHPDLNLSIAKEKIVVFFVGQLVRFDFFNKHDNNAHSYFHTIWPHEPDDTQSIGTQNLWRGYATEVYSQKTAALELICNIVEVQNWCKANNAKLLLVNSFTYDFDKELLTEALKYRLPHKEPNYLLPLIDEIDWSNLAELPDNRKQMIDILLDKEERPDLIGTDHIWYGWPRTMKSLTPKGYLTPCSHPSPKGHRLIAKTLADIINKKYYASS